MMCAYVEDRRAVQQGRTSLFRCIVKKSLVFDNPQVFDFLKVDSDTALLPS